MNFVLVKCSNQADFVYNRYKLGNINDTLKSTTMNHFDTRSKSTAMNHFYTRLSFICDVLPPAK